MNWTEFAACAGADPALFFPRKPTREAPPKVRAYCDNCDVVASCLAAGKDVPYGIWGGRTASQRGFPDRHLRGRRKAS